MSLSELSELSSELPPAADYFGFLGGAPSPLLPQAVLVRVVVRCRRVSSVGPNDAHVVEGGTVPRRLACASRSALSLVFLLGVNVFFCFLIYRSKSSARSVTVTGIGVNSQSMGSVCSFGKLGIAADSAPLIPALSRLTFIIILNIARCRYSISRL